MAELPASRITQSRPFSVTGVDYWGPILLKPAHRRAAPTKAFVAVFVCFSTKAVHLEVVGDLTTAKFIQALRRFVSRRGLCADLHSDNGRNFVCAANELRKLVRTEEHQQEIARECASNNIRWHFNPPKASHFGGYGSRLFTPPRSILCAFWVHTHSRSMKCKRCSPRLNAALTPGRSSRSAMIQQISSRSLPVIF